MTRLRLSGENICDLLCCWDVTNPNELLHVALVHNSPPQIKPHVPPSRSIELPHSALLINQQFCRCIRTGHFVLEG
jgi:hypothetical protein